MSGMGSSSEGSGPGKTSPRLIDDLLDYDSTNPRSNGANLLIDPAPVYRPPKLYPLRNLPKDCHHVLWRKDGQTSIRPFDAPATNLTKDISASFCSKCLQHFDVVVDYTKRAGRNVPCSVGSMNPLHHWQLINSKYPSENEQQSHTYKWGAYREQHTWACSSYCCPAVLTIRISSPRLNKSQSALLIDPQKVHTRGVRVIKESPDPERLGNHRPSLPCEVLSVLRTYLIHALDNAGKSTKRIAALNKRFLLAFGDDCRELLEYIGFTYQQETVGEGDAQHDEAFWSLPAVPPAIAPSEDLDTKTSRNFVEDILYEVMQRLNDRPREELKLGNSIIPYNPPPGIKDLYITFGCLDYPRDSRVVNLEALEHPHYASLGAVASLSDELVFFAYERQRDCDPTRKAYYLECLQGIGSGRESMFLQEEFVKSVSMGENTLAEIEDAYKFFVLNPLVDHDDDHVIGVYKSRVENAPLQKEEAKQALLVIGKSKDSMKLQEFAKDKAKTYNEALEYFGVFQDTPSDAIEAAAVAMAMDVDKAIVGPILEVIGNTRNDYQLQLTAATMTAPENGSLSLKEAYNRLQIYDENTSDESVFTYYRTLTEQAPAGSKASFLEALRIIAAARQSKYLFAKIGNPDAVISPPQSTEDEPVGLTNIGNTCYLNSLLQYYYTVKAVREVVMNFQTYQMPITAENIQRKRVGGRAVGKGEILKAQRFVEELQTLYQNLRSATSQSVRPSQDLAELTLLSTATEANFRRASISSPTGMQDLVNNVMPLSEPENPPPPPPDHAPPPVPTKETTVPSVEDADIEMLDRPSHIATDNEDCDSEATLVNAESKRGSIGLTEFPDANAISQPLSAAAALKANLSVEVPPATLQENDEVMVNGAPLTPPPEEMSPLEIRPPVPPRNKPAPIKTTEDSEASLREEKLKFGAQQDVTEVIGNVMFRLQCAIKPTSIDSKFGEQIDTIRETFYGANAVYLKKSNSYDVKVEDWANIIVFPAAEGQRDIYEALDVVFDEQVVEINNQNTTQFASINKLPPILQIQIQRTAFDPVTQQASKNQNRIVFEETIYLDRYMDDEKVFQRRRDAWKWKNRMRLLESRQRALEVTLADIPVTDALLASKDFLRSLEEEELDDIPIGSDLTEVLEDRAEEVKRELAALSAEIDSLRSKLHEQFTDLRRHRYSLQAVFIHRGTNAFGHYWIYIYDFANDVWREYNDERVSIVDDRKRIFEANSGATPYYLVYVRDDDKDKLVDAVYREIADESASPEGAVAPSGGHFDGEDDDMEGVTQHIEHYDTRLDARGPGNEDLKGVGAWEDMQATSASKDSLT